MIKLENGAIVGNLNKEEWTPLGPGAKQLEVHGDNITLCFVKAEKEAVGIYAPTPKGHRHYDMEQLTVMLEGSGVAIVDGKRYPVKAGSHWLSPIGIDHALDLRESEGCTIVQIFPSGHRPSNKPLENLKK